MEALATWKHGFEPNRISFSAISDDNTSLDAVELGARYCEADETCMSVGRGGIPDERGIVTLDASIMDHDGNCGSVTFVQQYLHPISIARKVMEQTSHVMLSAEGAERFAENNGFVRENLLTAEADALYKKWKELPDGVNVRLRRSEEGEHEYVFEYSENGKTKEINRAALRDQSHDTIGLLARDKNGKLAGACTTSGQAFKLHGRVGDSPIIGAGLFVDGEVGAAVATGNGELVMRACSAFHIVEMMRQGVEPDIAIATALERIRKDRHLSEDMQIGFLALRRDGFYWAGSLRPGFQFVAATDRMANTLYDCSHISFTPAT
ncbi:MAG: N(4)-(beta-N-acetylglucosaminyl)-L-asparaginase [Ignavibacteriota bacterium]